MAGNLHQLSTFQHNNQSAREKEWEWERERGTNANMSTKYTTLNPPSFWSGELCISQFRTHDLDPNPPPPVPHIYFERNNAIRKVRNGLFDSDWA